MAGGPNAGRPGLDPESTLPGIGCLRRAARGFPTARLHMVFPGLWTGRLRVGFRGFRMGCPLVSPDLRTGRLRVAVLGSRTVRPRTGFPGFRTVPPLTAFPGCPTARRRAGYLVCPTVRPAKVGGGSRRGRPRTVSRGFPTARRPMASPGPVVAIPSSVNPGAVGGS